MSCELQTPYDGDAGILLLVKVVLTIGKVKSLRLSQSFANFEEIFLLLLINDIHHVHVPSSNPVIELASDCCLAQSKTRPARSLDFLQWQLNDTTIHGQKCRSTRTHYPDFEPSSLYYSSLPCVQQRSRIYLFYCIKTAKNKHIKYKVRHTRYFVYNKVEQYNTNLSTEPNIEMGITKPNNTHVTCTNIQIT